jgi:hypothetical protein
MPTKRRYHSYDVYMGLYANEAVKRAVERHTEDFMQPDRFVAQDFYSGTSQHSQSADSPMQPS